MKKDSHTYDYLMIILVCVFSILAIIDLYHKDFIGCILSILYIATSLMANSIDKKFNATIKNIDDETTRNIDRRGKAYSFWTTLQILIIFLYARYMHYR